MLSANQEKSSLLLGDLGELAEVENEDLHQLPEEFPDKQGLLHILFEDAIWWLEYRGG